MKFRINYSKVMSQADEISDQASQLASQIQKLQQMEQDCRSIWKGEAAEAFLAKLVALRSEMSQTRSQMSTLANTIRTCAKRIQREDEKRPPKKLPLWPHRWVLPLAADGIMICFERRFYHGIHYFDVTPETLERSASTIEAKANEFATTYKSIYTAVSDLNVSYKGEASQTFNQRIQNYQNDFTAAKKALDNYVAFLRKYASDLRSSENNLKQVASNLSTGR